MIQGPYNIKDISSHVFRVKVVLEIFCGKVCIFIYKMMFSQRFKATIIFVLSVCPNGTTRLPPDGFSLNLIFEFFSNTCP